jgi:hypothetical protein
MEVAVEIVADDVSMLNTSDLSVMSHSNLKLSVSGLPDTILVPAGGTKPFLGEGFLNRQSVLSLFCCCC